MEFDRWQFAPACSRYRLISVPADNKIVTSHGEIRDLNDKESFSFLEKMDDYIRLKFFSRPLHFSKDGRKVIGIQVNGGSAGYPDIVYVWDAGSKKLIVPIQPTPVSIL
jgi:hypothetical protein